MEKSANSAKIRDTCAGQNGNGSDVRLSRRSRDPAGEPSDHRTGAVRSSGPPCGAQIQPTRESSNVLRDERRRQVPDVAGADHDGGLRCNGDRHAAGIHGASRITCATVLPADRRHSRRPASRDGGRGKHQSAEYIHHPGDSRYSAHANRSVHAILGEQRDLSAGTDVQLR